MPEITLGGLFFCFDIESCLLFLIIFLFLFFCLAWWQSLQKKKIYDDFVNVLLVFSFCLLRKRTIFYFRNQEVQADVFFAWPSLYSCEGHHSLLFKSSTTTTITTFFSMLSCYMEINAFICRILWYAMGNIFQ